MAATAFQAEILKRIARSRIDGGETYIAGGLALNHQLGRPRVSSGIDVFNSSYSALERAADHDCAVLKSAGYDIRYTRRRDYIVEVVASRGGDATELAILAAAVMITPESEIVVAPDAPERQDLLPGKFFTLSDGTSWQGGSHGSPNTPRKGWDEFYKV